MKIPVDTNVLLDVLQRREAHFAGAAWVWKVVEEKRIEGFVSAISFNNIFYIARRLVGRDTALEAIKRVRAIFDVLPVDTSAIDSALQSAAPDFEDAIQSTCAIAAGMDYIVTRNVPDFKSLVPPALTPEELWAIVSFQGKEQP